MVRRLLKEPVSLLWHRQRILRVAARKGSLVLLRLLMVETFARHKGVVLPMGKRGLFLPRAVGYGHTQWCWATEYGLDDEAMQLELLALTGLNAVPEKHWRQPTQHAPDDDGVPGSDVSAGGVDVVPLRRLAPWVGGCMRGGRRVALLHRAASKLPHVQAA